MRSIETFVPFLVGASTPVRAIIAAVTGYDEMPLDDGFPFPADAAEFASCVDLVEKHDLSPLLGLVAETSPSWWRIVANWDRLVAHLDADGPGWRNGEAINPAATNAAINTLYGRPDGPRRILLDMDGPLAAFDAHCWQVCDANGWHIDRSLEEQAARYMTDHMPDEAHRLALRDLIAAEGWFRALPVTPGAQDGVELLLAAGHEIVVCSKPHDPAPSCVAEKLAWLAEHFPMLNQYVFTPDKALSHGGSRGILLDDAIVHAQVPRATWEPIVFALPFNGPGTEWGRYPRWGWGDPIERLTW